MLKFMRGSQSEETVVLRERSKNGMHQDKTAQNPPLFYYLFFKKLDYFWVQERMWSYKLITPERERQTGGKQSGKSFFRSGWWGIVLTPLGVRAMWSPKFVNVVIWKQGNVGFSK